MISKIAGNRSNSPSTLFENTDGSTLAEKSNAGGAYDPIQELPTGVQEKVLKILQEILELK